MTHKSAVPLQPSEQKAVKENYGKRKRKKWSCRAQLCACMKKIQPLEWLTVFNLQLKTEEEPMLMTALKKERGGSDSERD